MGAHLVGSDDGFTFQSDKYPTCPAGKVPLSVKDVTAQDLLWKYAQRRRKVDSEFSDDLEQALLASGYRPKRELWWFGLAISAVLGGIAGDLLGGLFFKTSIHFRAIFVVIGMLIGFWDAFVNRRFERRRR